MSSMCDDLLLALAVSRYLKRNTNQFRKVGAHPNNACGLSFGEFHTLLHQLRNCPDRFFEYFRMSVQSFDDVKAGVEKKRTPLINTICVEERLPVTLRYSGMAMEYWRKEIVGDRLVMVGTALLGKIRVTKEEEEGEKAKKKALVDQLLFP
ncbi:hypothetical protein PR048_021188 [Dryococelus australis]|uniref:Uncharacterized protein n=1 Tax=Dryococelus australis TaxID=614101 RepID=A0ABQ9GXP1_9NEOP|nr:hypothetical protein PR048_021188 [Dryococelus australis]